MPIIVSSATISAEMELILCCTRTRLDSKTVSRIESLLQQELDWDRVRSMAHRHRVLPLLASNLLSLKSTCVPAVVTARLKQFFHQQGRHNLALTNKLLKFARILEQHGISALFFKGPSFAASTYGNILLRQNGDLDLLVREENLAAAIALIMAQGYETTVDVPWETHLSCTDGNKIDIDLHRRILPKHLSQPLSNDYVWSHLEAFSLNGTTVSVLSPEVNLLIICLNGNKESWQKLGRICDVAELVRANPQLDWEQVFADARSMGFVRILSLALLLAQRLLQAKLPDLVVSQIEVSGAIDSLYETVVQQLEETNSRPGTIEKTLFHIKTRERWRDKVQSFQEVMTFSGWVHPSATDKNVVALPHTLAWLYYFIRPVRVAKKYSKTLWRYLV